MNQLSKSRIFLILAAILWSIGGFLIKEVNLSPLAITGWRSFIAAIVFILFLQNPKLHFSRPQLLGSISYASAVLFYNGVLYPLSAKSKYKIRHAE